MLSPYIFESFDSKAPLTARRVHLRRLYDILNLCIQRHDFQRAKRVWDLLVQCKEFDWKALWSTGLLILSQNTTDEERMYTEIDYLRGMMLKFPEDRELILKELFFRLLYHGKCREALDELELYLPSVPYQDDPVLHTYAGLASLYLAQSSSGSSKPFNPMLIREAQTHFEQALSLDPENSVAKGFLEKISALQNKQQQEILEETDDERKPMDPHLPHRKRFRT